MAKAKIVGCPSCGEKAILEGDIVTCEACGVEFEKRNEETKVKSVGRLDDHEQRIAALEAGQKPTKPKEEPPEEEEDL